VKAPPIKSPRVEPPPVEPPPVGPIATTTAVGSSASPSVVGQVVTYTATVSAALATGTVEFKDGGVVISGCGAQLVVLGVAKCVVAGYASAATHSITAVYSGDLTYLGSVSAVFAQVVGKAITTTSVMSSANPSVVGQAVTYTATVNAPVATGTVEFRDGGAAISGCSARAVSSGSATCVASAYMAVATHSITAVYSGNGNYVASTSSTVTQVVGKASTTTSVGSSASPSVVGQAVTYTATVSATAATGTVEFKDGAVVIGGCGARTVSSGGATCVVSGYAGAATHSITAVYSGDGNYVASTSSTLTQVVGKATTTTVVGSSANPSKVSQAVTYTATVSATAATGTVEFKDGGVAIGGCGARAVSSGGATCVVSGYAAAATHSITAVYSGDGNYLGSPSAALSQVVGKASTTTAVGSSANPSKVGGTVTYTATVSATAATGTVEFKDGGVTIGGCGVLAVSSGAATCVVGAYGAAATHSITAVYSGDGNYVASTSSALTQVVEEVPVETPAPFRFFSSTSFWNEPVPAGAPVDPNSAAMVSAFDGEIAAAELAKEHMPNINTNSWSVPIYTVPATQATVKVTQEVAYAGKLNAALQSAWDAVPLPPEAKPAAGTDRDLVVWQPSTDKLWEFWGLEKTEEGWLAKWGGAMNSASSDPGVYGPEAWPGAQTGWGVSATSLSVAGGLITLEDLERGQINHALALAIPNARAGEYASPAQRTDGYSSELTSLPEGAHLRLDPSLNLASLHLPHLTLVIAEAAQRYGIFVRDSAVNVAFCAQDPTPTGTNPYAGAHGYFEGKSPQQLLESFPWHSLEVLKMELH